jgi:hypothetical protein
VDELMQIGPILPVEAGNIGSVELGECGFGHGRSFALRETAGLNLTQGARRCRRIGFRTPKSLARSF